MGYLQLATGLPNFTKAVISFWFRIPQGMMDAASSRFDEIQAEIDGGAFVGEMMGLIPLITFGPMANHSHLTAGTFPIAPTMIGILCTPADAEPGFGGNPGVNALFARLQTAVTTVTPTETEPTYSPDYFQVGGYSTTHDQRLGGPIRDQASISVSPDQWHHVLVSFDLTNGSSTSLSSSGEPPSLFSINAASKFFLAFDDVNRNGHYLWPYTAQSFAAGDSVVEIVGATGANDIWSNWCNFFGELGQGASPVLPGNTPITALPVGIPGSSAASEFVPGVKMAELQVFTGVTLDTSVTANRRAFIGADGRPVNPLAARALLGKVPDILLHGSNNWTTGRNTGSRGTLEVTGTISALPAPILGS